MPPLVVVVIEELPQARQQLLGRLVIPQVDMVVFDRAPQSLDHDVVHRSAASVHADADSMIIKHSRKGVADLARAIAKEMGLDHEQIEVIHMAATIHDLGKKQVPAEILNKPGVLTPLEFEMI